MTAPTTAVLIVARDAAGAERVATALRRGTQPPAQIAALLPEAPARPLDGVTTAVADDAAPGAARRELIDGLDADLLLVLSDVHAPDPLLVAQVAATFAAGDADALSLVVRDPRVDRTEPAPDYRLPIDLCAFVPLPGPPLAGLLYPALAVGAYAIRREALSAVGGYAEQLAGDAADHELLARLALAGSRLELLPDPLLTATADDAWSELRARPWGTVLPSAETDALRAALVGPFRERQPPELADLPALAAGKADASARAAAAIREQLAAHAATRSGLEARIGELDATLAASTEAYERHVREQQELIALYERQKEQLHAQLRERDSATGAIAWGVRRALRGPVSGWPARARRKLAGRRSSR